MNFLKNIFSIIFNKKHRTHYFASQKALMYWFWKRDYPKAIEVYKSLLEKGAPSSAESQTYCDIGEVYYWDGNIEEAEKALRKSLDLRMKTKGHDAHLHELLGDICGKKGQYQEALMFYEKAVQFGSKGLINKMIMNMDNVLRRKALLEENKARLPFMTAYFQQNKDMILKRRKNRFLKLRKENSE